MTACANGHVINSRVRRDPGKNAAFCQKCGLPAIAECEACKAQIPGALIGYAGGVRAAPDFCKECGTAFPWKTSADAAKPEQKTASREKRLVTEADDVAALLRAIPRGLRELTAEHRHGGLKGGRSPFEIEDEYDLQDFVRALFQMWYPQAVKAEESVPTWGGKGGRVDFILDGLKWLIELKVFRDEADWRITMFPDITSKIERYGNDPRCDLLYFLIYDPNQAFRSAAAVEKELSKVRTIGEKKFRVRVIVTPQA